MIHKRSVIALLFPLAFWPALAPAAFDRADWSEQWITPFFHLRFNYYHDAQQVIHVRNASIRCKLKDNKQIDNLTRAQVDDIANPLRETIAAMPGDTREGLAEDDPRRTDKDQSAKLVHLRYYDPKFETFWARAFDFSDNPALMKKVKERSEKLCGK